MRSDTWEPPKVVVVLYQNGSILFVNRNRNRYPGFLADRVSGSDGNASNAAVRIAKQLLHVDIVVKKELAMRYARVDHETYVAVSYVLAEAVSNPNPLPGYDVEVVPRGQLDRYRRNNVIGSDIEEMIELALKEQG